jgi:hypothetical protein
LRSGRLQVASGSHLCVGLLALLLQGCGGVASSSSAEATSDASGTTSRGSDGGSNNSGTSFAGTNFANGGTTNANSDGGTATVGGSDGAFTVAGGGNSEAGSAGAPPPAMHAALACKDPTPGPHGGGYSACSDGSLRRVSAAACGSALPRATAALPLALSECVDDTDCVASAHGYCAYGGCKYGCVTDDECASDQACFCGDFVGTCIPANCRSDADCATNFPCTAYRAVGFATPDALSCQSPVDECLTDAQCSSLNPRVSCKVQIDHRVCFTNTIG